MEGAYSQKCMQKHLRCFRANAMKTAKNVLFKHTCCVFVNNISQTHLRVLFFGLCWKKNSPQAENNCCAGWWRPAHSVKLAGRKNNNNRENGHIPTRKSSGIHQNDKQRIFIFIANRPNNPMAGQINKCPQKKNPEPM